MCGQICKEILDRGAALGQSVACMSNSVLLHAAAGGSDPSSTLAQDFQAKANAAAQAAQALAASLQGS